MVTGLTFRKTVRLAMELAISQSGRLYRSEKLNTWRRGCKGEGLIRPRISMVSSRYRCKRSNASATAESEISAGSTDKAVVQAEGEKLKKLVN